MDIEATQSSKYWRDLYYTTFPFAIILLAGIFVACSIIFDRFMAYSLDTFFYALGFAAIWRFYQDRLFFLQKSALEEKEYLEQVEFYNRRFHIANLILLGIWVWMLFASRFF